MNFTRVAEQFRLNAAVRRSFSAPSRYTPELRAQAVAYWRARRAGGGTQAQISTELEVDLRTLRNWVSGAVAVGGAMLARVELVREPSLTRLVVYGPRGLRIEGLDMETLASLLERLG